MKLFIHKKDQKVYGQTGEGLTYILIDNGEWDPTLHTPTTGMRELPSWEYPVTYQSFKQKVGL
jgi:hypothetical protein